MPKSTLTLCQSRLYPPVRDFGFGLWNLLLPPFVCRSRMYVQYIQSSLPTYVTVTRDAALFGHGFFSKQEFSADFLYKSLSEEQRRCGGREVGAQRPVLCVSQPKKKGTRSALARSSAKPSTTVYLFKSILNYLQCIFLPGIRMPRLYN